MNLKDHNKKELEAELARREKAEKREEWARCEREGIIFLDNIDALIAITPHHDRTSCSDDNLANDDGRCLKCVLMTAKEDHWWDWKKFGLDIYLRSRP